MTTVICVSCGPSWCGLLHSNVWLSLYVSLAHLKKQLEDYFAAYKKVEIVRGQSREGLIRARLLGAKFARSPVITYLDSHCECAEGE